MCSPGTLRRLFVEISYIIPYNRDVYYAFRVESIISDFNFELCRIGTYLDFTTVRITSICITQATI